ncbi:hypothetical protein SAY86_008435 [Trapa natans]|uniref:Uncharacterized protein n=1 Tax=Trapa natans TaxID=22666 RepID=A0AAN7KFC7_TRANT|nr:hypothetical protein SAY86_008435 [Trapa natans]
MGVFFSDKGATYKPVKDVNLGPNSNELYLPANVRAPRAAGFLVKIFVWFLESKFLGPLLMHFLKRDNLIHKLITDAEIKEPPIFVPSHLVGNLNEEEVMAVDSHSSVPSRVQNAVDCLPSPAKSLSNGLMPSSVHHWTVMDYWRAYSSGAITPIMESHSSIDTLKNIRSGSNLSKCRLQRISLQQ